MEDFENSNSPTPTLTMSIGICTTGGVHPPPITSTIGEIPRPLDISDLNTSLNTSCAIAPVPITLIASAARCPPQIRLPPIRGMLSLKYLSGEICLPV